MKAVIQRVSQACVRIKGEEISGIGKGLLILLAVKKEDNSESAKKMAEKIATLRIFSDMEGKMNLSILDINGEALIVSQFTLYGRTTRGRRPDFTASAPAIEANRLYQEFIQDLREQGVSVKSGRFGEEMDVEMINQGPVTLIVET